MASILLIEDEPRIAASVQRGLQAEQHVVDVRFDGPAGLSAARAGTWDLLIVDWMLPGCTGIALCQALRAEGAATPILMLTARDDTADVVRGLDAGADDYLVKPFAFQELVARTRALLRRPAAAPSNTWRFGPLAVDPLSRRITWAEREVVVTAREFQLLEALVRRPGMVLPRETLNELLWSADEEPGSNALEVHISSLRRKLASVGATSIIRTVRGVGYGLQDDPA